MELLVALLFLITAQLGVAGLLAIVILWRILHPKKYDI